MTVNSAIGRFLLLCFCFGCAAHEVSSAEVAQPSLLIITSSLTEREAALYVAQDYGFFRRNGVDVNIVQARTAPLALSTIISGDAKVLWGSVSTSNLSAIAEGLDLVFVAGFVNKLSGTIMANPTISKPQDLRGKALGFNSLSGGGWDFTMVALEHWGISPVRDKMQFRVLGQQNVIAQGLINGSVDAAYLSYAYAKFVKDRGLHQLADLRALPVAFQGPGVVALRNFVRSSPAVTENVIRALADSVDFIRQPNNKNQVVHSLMKNLRLTKIDEALEGYQRLVDLYERKPYPTVDGLANAIRVIGRSHDKVLRLKAEDLVVDSIVRKLDSAGRFK